MSETNSCMYTHPLLEALRQSPDACACASLRKATRLTTQMYDHWLAPSGLSAAQFSLLATLYYTRRVPMGRLAARLMTERSTLTRTLAPLDRRGLVEITAGHSDGRVRDVVLTAAGLEALISALPLWQRAQDALAAALGPEGWDRLRATLGETERAARRVAAECKTGNSSGSSP